MKTYELPVLTNGAIEAIDSNPKLIGFILGALDKGFTVRWPGAVVAKKGLSEIFFYAQGENRSVDIYKGEYLLLSTTVDAFQWANITVWKGRIYYKDQFLK